MIVPEEILKEIFAQLPPAKDGNNVEFPIKFSWGSEIDLPMYLKSLNGSKYPLIWAVLGTDEVDDAAHIVRQRAKLVIAKASKNASELNPTAWQNDFKLILNPILGNVVKALEKSGVTKIVSTKYKVSRRANYTEEIKGLVGDGKTQSYSTDLWNVILWEGEIEFAEKSDGKPLCINTIRF